MARLEQKSLKCAIYTRKSTEEGLEQSFNSLDAQREACEAFAKSQAHEGWQVLPEHYDDGGFSGGNVDRPALIRLLRDIDEGRVDVIIVYKVDRLSRSLADFVRLIERFDALDVSFVSVTQQFNTSSSMGRLTLNVLLSFAQFEREVTSERIRDKIAASKRRGMWMGGLVPLGYDRVEKQLVVNADEAELVRHIFSRYLALGCVRQLKAELENDGFRSKGRPNHHKRGGGKPFARGALYTVLKSPVYRGKVHHKGELHEGRHAAIVDNALWQAVQEKLSRNRQGKNARASAKYPSLLAGLLFDDQGNRMSPTYTRRKNRHYAYYISQAVLQYRENEAGSVLRVPAKTLDDTVSKLLMDLLSSAKRLLDLLRPYALPSYQLDAAIQAGARLVKDWHTLPVSEQVPILIRCVDKVILSRHEVRVTVAEESLVKLIIGEDEPFSSHVRANTSPERTLTQAVSLRRSGIESKLIYPAKQTPIVHQRSVRALQKALFNSLQWNEELVTGKVRSVEELIERDQLNPRQTHRQRKLAFLAPDIMERIVAGDVPETLTLERLKKDFPLDWRAQHEHFGLKSSTV
jgi:DNA invertase Pin-like site-specific DNA recombinase